MTLSEDQFETEFMCKTPCFIIFTDLWLKKNEACVFRGHTEDNFSGQPGLRGAVQNRSLEVAPLAGTE